MTVKKIILAGEIGQTPGANHGFLWLDRINIVAEVYLFYLLTIFF